MREELLFAFDKSQLFIGDKPLQVNAGTTELKPVKVEHTDDVPKIRNFAPKKFEMNFDVEVTDEMRKLINELTDSTTRAFTQWMEDVNVATRKILTEYIDEPFTTDPFKATKEEFEKRHINALVYRDFADGSRGFIGVLQGSTLVCINGMKIENFKV